LGAAVTLRAVLTQLCPPVLLVAADAFSAAALPPAPPLLMKPMQVATSP
jgi:hypothetical protein